MKKHLVWLDCDTGTDDAQAILCANALPELEITAISAVAGNVELEKTYRNALRLNRLMGTAYPVYQGAEKPWLRELETGYKYHGENGLGGVELPLPDSYPETTEPAWDALYRKAVELGDRLEIIATGPLTNVGTALEKYPDLPKHLRRIVIMGGSATGGNRTPAAEYNIYADPHAAAAVFRCGVPIFMCGLDVTMQAVFTEEDLVRIGSKGTKAARLFCDALMTPLHAQEGGDGVKLHDAVAVLFAARPELFTGREAGVFVETQGGITLGKTVTDLWSDKKFPQKNAFVVLGLDHAAFVQTVQELIWSYED